MDRAEAFIFDMNGTMVDDMKYHTDAWYHVLNEDLHAGLSREQVKKEMYGKNGELLIRVFGENHFTPRKLITGPVRRRKYTGEPSLHT